MKKSEFFSLDLDLNLSQRFLALPRPVSLSPILSLPTCLFVFSCLKHFIINFNVFEFQIIGEINKLLTLMKCQIQESGREIENEGEGAIEKRGRGKGNEWGRKKVRTGGSLSNRLL